MKPYQSLRDFDDLPRLPSGYPGMFVLAAIPPLWFRVMIPKMLAWAGGDLTRLNRDLRLVPETAAAAQLGPNRRL